MAFDYARPPITIPTTSTSDSFYLSLFGTNNYQAQFKCIPGTIYNPGLSFQGNERTGFGNPGTTKTYASPIVTLTVTGYPAIFFTYNQISLINQDTGFALNITGSQSQNQTVTFPDATGIPSVFVNPPGSLSDPGVPGMIAEDSNYFYYYDSITSLWIKISNRGGGTVFWGGVAGGSINAYTATISPTPTLTTGFTVIIQITSTTGSNTGPTTLNVNSLGAINVYNVGNPCVGGELISNGIYLFTYDGTQWNLLNSSLTTTDANVSSAIYAGTVTGSVNSYTASVPVTPILTPGLIVTFKMGISLTNTGNSTLNINSLGVKSIQYSGSALSSGMLVSGQVYVVMYDGTQWELINGEGTGGGGGSPNLDGGFAASIYGGTSGIDGGTA